MERLTDSPWPLGNDSFGGLFCGSDNLTSNNLQDKLVWYKGIKFCRSVNQKPIAVPQTKQVETHIIICVLHAWEHNAKMACSWTNEAFHWKMVGVHDILELQFPCEVSLEWCLKERNIYCNQWQLLLWASEPQWAKGNIYLVQLPHLTTTGSSTGLTTRQSHLYATLS